jgi:methionyl-tRNA formyltransferase
MKIQYFSSGPRHRVLKALIDEGFEIENVIVTNPQKAHKINETIEVAQFHEIPVRIVKKTELKTLGQYLGKTLYLSVGFRYLFPTELIESAETCLNVHCTLLPHYRGAVTLNWIIENNEPVSGVTIHRIDTGIDTGDILLQKAFPLNRFETGKSLYRKNMEFEPDVVVEALKLYASGHAKYIAQDNSNVIQYPNRTPECSELDSTKPLIALYDKIRAADPIDYPAHFYLEGQKVCIKLWREEKPDSESDMI